MIRLPSFCLALLLITQSGCSSLDMESQVRPPTSEPDRERPRRSKPEPSILGSQIRLPARAYPGETIHGVAPAGSRVEMAGQELRVPEDRWFELHVPKQANGELEVHITRPDGRVMVLRLTILEP